MRKSRLRRLLCAIILSSTLVFIPSCREKALPEAWLKEYLDRREAVFEDISVQMGYAVWCLYTAEAPADLDTPRQRYLELFQDDSLTAVIDRAYDDLDAIEDDLLRRRVEIWHNMLTSTKVNFSADVLSLQTSLEKWLAADDSARGRPSDEELEVMMRELIDLRNDKAGELGYDHYAELALEISGLGYDWFHGFVRKIDSATQEPYRNLLARAMDGDAGEIEFADIAALVDEYQESIEVPGIEGERQAALMKETAEGIGIRYDWLPLRVVEKDPPATIAGQGIAVHIPHDFRMVIRPDLSLGDRMHELGHGMQWMFTKTESPLLKGYEWIPGNICGAWAEGMGETMKRFTRNAQWLKRYTDLTEEEIAARIDRRNKCAPAKIRYQLSTIMLEIEVYTDPDRDPRDILRDLEKRYLFLDRRILQTIPLARMLYVSYPVYSQNYLLADVISWQVHTALEEKFGEGYAFDPRVGVYLEKYLYEDGEFHPWRTRLEMATGRGLDVDGYLRSLGL